MPETPIQKYHLHKNEPEKLQFEVYPLKEFLIENAAHTQKPHVHSYYQIIWFKDGMGQHRVDFETYKVKANSLFFISKGQIHHFDENYPDGFIIHFNASFIDYSETFTEVFMKHNIFHSFEKEPLFKIKEKDRDILLNIVLQMQEEVKNPNQFGHREYMKVLLHLFLILTQRLGVREKSGELSMNNPSHILLVRFQKLLEESFFEIHTVFEYAALLNVSAKTLTNCTRENLQQTPLEIINERITLEAKRLLTYSDKNVSEIAYQLGFSDASNFVKFFKRNTQIAPRDFRKAVS
ncbi:AraC family transcriptional regulator [Mangrovibacterium diazotrophicum]|uniref:AraC-like DNA-binding protein n=1 Tax=Mangrovibacterium diazotrophicum TaxID=1261403 RepID=A0A419W4M6_9BACT|nr:helix-turn-helix domain-containing protein [Mangrovibacterium diazotrophicum]RKD90414.1 AraC-like DNA-binding protein [Mangrovibacterium diazotrophicum]